MLIYAQFLGRLVRGDQPQPEVMGLIGLLLLQEVNCTRPRQRDCNARSRRALIQWVFARAFSLVNAARVN